MWRTFNPGNATQEQVFLLSITEVNKYFSSDSARQCKPTDYAVANGAYVGDNGNCLWWVRSLGDRRAYTAFGGLYNVNYGKIAVRPAMWIEIK